MVKFEMDDDKTWGKKKKKERERKREGKTEQPNKKPIRKPAHTGTTGRTHITQEEFEQTYTCHFISAVPRVNEKFGHMTIQALHTKPTLRARVWKNHSWNQRGEKATPAHVDDIPRHTTTNSICPFLVLPLCTTILVVNR